MPESFHYVADEKTRTLIIGSMPGIASLQALQYYAHQYNLFWPLVFEAFGKTFAQPSYEDKLDLLAQNHIGLWDAAAVCQREGSLDSAIKNAIPNDFEELFQLYPQIERLLFNGQTAFKIFKRFHPNWLKRKKYLLLPSTSPANASIPLAQRRQVWLEALRQWV